MIDSRVIEEIKSRNDIVDVISAYVNLKRAGSNYQGLWKKRLRLRYFQQRRDIIVSDAARAEM